MNARTAPVDAVVVARPTSAREPTLDMTRCTIGSGLHFCAGLLLFLGVLAGASSALGQVLDSASSQNEMEPMNMPMTAEPLGIEHTRNGSGTSWLPDASPMQGLMTRRGEWSLMLHANAFVHYIKAGGDRGDDQFGSINWIMGMAQRSAAGGQLQLRTMFSAEPATVGRCGYPDLLQSGESCNGEPLHDRQHPHDLFMELAADYRREVTKSLAFETYAGLSGDPALGPTAYPHRLSAMPNPMSPISHHWLDSTHVSFGVVTGGVYGRKWKVESSVFNGREPDDRRYDFDFGALDSYSGRVWFLPTSHWSLQASAARLKGDDAPSQDIHQQSTRLTASATYHRLVNARVWSSTVAFGQNRENGITTSALLVETAADISRDDVVFGRIDVGNKTAADLALPIDTDDTFTVAKLQIGWIHWMMDGYGLRLGLGASGGLSIVPAALAAVYGARTAGEVGLFLTIRTGA